MEDEQKERLQDCRERHRVNIRKQKWQKEIEQHRKETLAESDRQLHAAVLAAQSPNIRDLAKRLAAAPAAAAQSMQQEFLGQAIQRIHELRSDDLEVLNLLQLKTKTLSETYLQKVLEMLKPVGGQSLSKRYRRCCLGYLSISSSLQIKRRSTHHLLAIFNLFLNWWNEECDFDLAQVCHFLSCMLPFCRLERELYDNMMVVVRYALTSSWSERTISKSLLYLIVLIAEDRQDLQLLNPAKKQQVRLRQQAHMDHIIENDECLLRILKTLEYEPTLACVLIRSFLENEQYHERLLMFNLHYQWVPRCCKLIERQDCTKLVLAILSSLACERSAVDLILKQRSLLEAIRGQPIAIDCKQEVADLYIKLVYFVGNNDHRLQLLQEFDVIGLIITDIEWDKPHIDIVSDMLETLKLLTAEQRIPGLVRSHCQEAVAKALHSPLMEDVENQLETIQQHLDTHPNS